MLLDLLNHEKSLNLSEGDGGGAGNPAETDKDKEKDKWNEGKGNLKTKLDCLKLKKDCSAKMITLKKAKRLKLKWQLLNNQYEQFSLKNGRAFYRWRCSIGDEEKDFTLNFMSKKEKSNYY